VLTEAFFRAGFAAELATAPVFAGDFAFERRGAATRLPLAAGFKAVFFDFIGISFGAKPEGSGHRVDLPKSETQ
jgi:hypothetical protein